MPDLGSFRPEFEQIIVIFKISTFKFDNMSSFILNKTFSLGLKLPYLGIFRKEFEKKLLYSKSVPSNFSVRKVSW